VHKIFSIILFLFPIHLVFIKIKNFLYDNNFISPTRVDAKIISVGNVSLGGTGKTPFTIALSNFLKEKKGFSVGVVTRGYGRKNSHHNFLFNNHSWQDCGDEVIVLTNNLSRSIPVYISSNKILGAKELSTLGCDIVILDDAFQHRKLSRDVDIVLLSPDELVAKNQKTFPWGLLREPFYNIKRANIIITTKMNLYNNQILPPNSLPLNTSFQKELLSSGDVPKITIKQLSKVKNVLSLCGIGKPASFQNSLENLGISVKKHLTYSDHHSFTEKDIANILSHIKKLNIQSIVCTEKDWVKLMDFDDEISIPIYAIRLNYCLNKDIEEAVLRLL
jgi:tetraacyldisaccharide 4'-kinase